MSEKHSALIIGAGIAGLQASIDLAKVGFDVYLVEQEPRLGGHTSLLHKVFPTLENATELMKPVIQSVVEHLKIKIASYSEIKSVSGSIGNFYIDTARKARYVDEKRCTLCDECSKVCPVNVPKEYEMGLGNRKAIYLPSLFPLPQRYLIDKETCLYFKNCSCTACRDACPENAINYEEKDKKERLKADVIVVATGFKPYDVRKIGQYKYGVYRNVITGLEYERLCSSNGPTEGEIVRIDNERKLRSVVYVLCVGSRDEQHLEYCCRIGCVNALKHAHFLKNQYGREVEAYICYTDLRAVGKHSEKFYRQVRESKVNFIHGEPSEIRELPDKTLTIDVYDQATSKLLSITADLVVLETGLEPNTDLQRQLGVPLNENGFFKVAHPQLAAHETPIEGIFLAGSVQEPMNVSETVAHSSAVAMKALISAQK